MRNQQLPTDGAALHAVVKQAPADQRQLATNGSVKTLVIGTEYLCPADHPQWQAAFDSVNGGQPASQSAARMSSRLVTLVWKLVPRSKGTSSDPIRRRRQERTCRSAQYRSRALS